MGWIIQLLGKLRDLTPGRMQWHAQMVLCEDLLVVHKETALAVEWQGIRMPLIGERRHDRLEQIVIVVAALLGGRHLVKVRLYILNPAIMGPDRSFIATDSRNIELSSVG